MEAMKSGAMREGSKVTMASPTYRIFSDSRKMAKFPQRRGGTATVSSTMPHTSIWGALQKPAANLAFVNAAE